MLRLLTRPALREPLWTAALLLAAAALILAPGQTMKGASDGLALCGNVIVPSLFPFLILSALTVELGLAERIGTLLGPVMAPLFRVNGSCACALVLGFIGGYPIGARTAIRLYEAGLCSRDEAQRLLAFCNNSGPAFLFGVVGAGVFADSRVACLLYFIHIFSSLCVGLLFRFYGRSEASRSAPSVPIHTVRFSSALTASVSSALQSTLNICSFVLLFSVILSLLTHFGILALLADGLAYLFAPLGLTAPWARRLLTGLLELSSGVWSLSGSVSLRGSLPMAAFLLGWAGLSVHCQVLSFLGESGLGMGSYLLGKGLHAVLSAVFTAAAVSLFPLSRPVSSYLAEAVDALGSRGLSATLPLSTLLSLVLALLFLLIGSAVLQKSSGKKQKKRV